MRNTYFIAIIAGVVLLLVSCTKTGALGTRNTQVKDIFPELKIPLNHKDYTLSLIKNNRLTHTFPLIEKHLIGGPSNNIIYRTLYYDMGITTSEAVLQFPKYFLALTVYPDETDKISRVSVDLRNIFLSFNLKTALNAEYYNQYPYRDTIFSESSVGNFKFRAYTRFNNNPQHIYATIAMFSKEHSPVEGYEVSPAIYLMFRFLIDSM